MAVKKLTLSADEVIIDEAKRLAVARHTTVSAMFSRLLHALAHAQDIAKSSLGPLTKKASGIVKLESAASYEDTLTDALKHKYGLDS